MQTTPLFKAKPGTCVTITKADNGYTVSNAFHLRLHATRSEALASVDQCLKGCDVATPHAEVEAAVGRMSLTIDGLRMLLKLTHDYGALLGAEPVTNVDRTIGLIAEARAASGYIFARTDEERDEAARDRYVDSVGVEA